MSNSAFASIVSNIRGKWKAHDYIRLSVFIIATSLVLYWQFVFGNMVFAFTDVAVDTYHQYLKVYEFFSSAIKDGTLSSYTFQNGFGNSIFSLTSYVSDPFSMLGVLTGVIFGQEYIADSMIYILILKHICVGVLCLYYLKGFNFSLRSSMISAYVYAFAGYIPLLGEHYFFAVRPIYLLLLLIMLEKVIKGDHKIRYWCGLLYVSALVTASGATAAYELFLAAGFYALYRVIYIYGKNIKMIFKRLGISLAFVLGGIGIASFWLFPMLDRISGSDRLVHSGNYFSFSEFDFIKSCIMRLFSNQLEGTSNSWYGSMGYYTNVFGCFFSVMLVPLAAQFIWRTFKDKFTVKDKILRMIPVATVVFFIIDKFIAYLFGFFIWHYHSYAYIFLPMFAVLFADVIDNTQKGKFSRRTNYLTMIFSAAVIVWGGISTHNEGSTTSLMWMMFSVVMLVFGTVSLDVVYLSSNGTFEMPRMNTINKMAVCGLSAVIVLNLFCENYITTNYDRMAITKEISHGSMLTSEIVDDINNNEGDNFFRFETTYYEGRMCGYTYPFLFPMRATAYYDSAINNDLPEFYKKMFGVSKVNNCNNYIGSCAQVKNTVTEDILGIKYLLLTSDIQRNGWEKIADYSDNEVALYENSGLESAGLLFDNYITQKDADAMSFSERTLGMATRIILDNPPDNIGDYAAEQPEQDTSRDAINIAGSSAWLGQLKCIGLEDGKYDMTVNLDSATSTVSFALNTDIINDSKKATQISFEFEDTYPVKGFQYFDMVGQWNLIPEFTPKKDGEKTICTFMVPQNAKAIAFSVNEGGKFDFAVSSKTVTAAYTNEGIHLNNPDRGDTITGSVDVQKDSLLYLPVLYNKDWNAYVDGEKVEIIKANYAFSAIPVKAGQHSISFIYVNQTYHKFQKVSIVVFVVMNGFLVVYAAIRKKREKNKPQSKEKDV